MIQAIRKLISILVLGEEADGFFIKYFLIRADIELIFVVFRQWLSKGNGGGINPLSCFKSKYEVVGDDDAFEIFGKVDAFGEAEEGEEGEVDSFIFLGVPLVEDWFEVLFENAFD